MSDVAEPLYAAVADLLTLPPDMRVAYDPTIDYATRIQMVEEQSVDLAWVCGLYYTVLGSNPAWQYRPLAAPCMVGEAEPVYYGDIIVHKQSRFSSFEDLRGAAWAYNEEMSFSGYQMLQPYLAEKQEGGPYFGRKIQSGSHLQSLDMVSQGQIDSAVIDSTILQMLSATEPARLANIRVIDRIGPFAVPLLVLSERAVPQFDGPLRSALTNLHQSDSGRQLLTTWQIDHFASVDDRDYDGIRQAMATSRHVTL